MNEQIWKSIAGFVPVNEYPKLPCPYCGIDELCLDPESVRTKPLPAKYKEMAGRHYRDLEKEQKARVAQNNKDLKEAYEEDTFLGILIGVGSVLAEISRDIESMAQTTAFLECSKCKGAVSAVGLAKVFTSKSKTNLVRPSEVKFEYFTPSVPMMALSKNLPRTIRLELMDAFKHYHFDPPSSASKLRRAIEKFCIDNEAQGKNLHRQIESLKTFLPLEAQYLEALKLVGNEGTHSDGVNEDDLLLAFQVIQYVLEHYDRKKRFEETFKHYEKINEKFHKPKAAVEKPEVTA